MAYPIQMDMRRRASDIDPVHCGGDVVCQYHNQTVELLGRMQAQHEAELDFQRDARRLLEKLAEGLGNIEGLKEKDDEMKRSITKLEERFDKFAERIEGRINKAESDSRLIIGIAIFLASAVPIATAVVQLFIK